MSTPNEPKFQKGQYVMRRKMTPEQEAEKRAWGSSMFAERVGKYPWDRLAVLEVLPDGDSFIYTCQGDKGGPIKVREDELREVDPSEKHGWRGE